MLPLLLLLAHELEARWLPPLAQPCVLETLGVPLVGTQDCSTGDASLPSLLAAELRFEGAVELDVGGRVFVSRETAVAGVGMFQEVKVVGCYVCFFFGSHLVEVDFVRSDLIEDLSKDLLV